MSPIEGEHLMTPVYARERLENAGFYADDIGYQTLEEHINSNPTGFHFYIALLRIAQSTKPQYFSDVYQNVRKHYHLPPNSDNWDSK